jgi:hypothetical protein
MKVGEHLILVFTSAFPQTREPVAFQKLELNMRPTITTFHEWEAPYKAVPTRKIKAHEFDSYRRIITDLYITEDHSLDAVRKIMAERYKFYGK